MKKETKRKLISTFNDVFAKPIIDIEIDDYFVHGWEVTSEQYKILSPLFTFNYHMEFTSAPKDGKGYADSLKVSEEGQIFEGFISATFKDGKRRHFIQVYEGDERDYVYRLKYLLYAVLMSQIPDDRWISMQEETDEENNT